MFNCINCKKELNEIEYNDCHSCSDGNDNCNVSICLECEKDETIYNSYFEHCNGYLDICKPCYVIRCKK